MGQGAILAGLSRAPFPDSMVSQANLPQNTWTKSVQRWARLAGWPGALSAILSLFTLIGLSLLYRELPVREAGMLAVVLSISDILSLVALLGVGTIITRLYAVAEHGVFNWPVDLAATAGYALPIIALGSIGTVRVYGLPVWAGGFVLLLTVLSTLLVAAYAMLNSRGHHAWSAFLVRAPNAALFVPGLAGASGVSNLTVTAILIFFLVSTASALILAILLLRRAFPPGSRRVSRRERYAGLAFMAISATDMLPDQGLIVVAGRILPLSQVAAFAAVAIFLRPFRLLRSVLAMVLAPDLLRFRRHSYRRLISGVWIFACVCGLAAAILVPPLASSFYGGRYQQAMAWIPYLALAGILLIGMVPARADLSVRAPISVMNRFAITYVAAMLLSTVVCIAGMYVAGAVFLAVAVVLLQLTETGVAYAFWLGFRRWEANP